MTQRTTRRWSSLSTIAFLALIITLFSAARVFALPDLAPYQPPGWSSPVVVAVAPSQTSYTGPYSPSDTLYVSWAVANFGDAEADNFYVDLYVDGVDVDFWSISSLPSFVYDYVLSDSIGSLSPGTHTIAVVADIDGFVAENNENNNAFTNTITVQNPLTTADLLPVNVAVTPNAISPGGTISVGYTVTNQGVLSASASHTVVTIKDFALNVVTQQVFVTVPLAIGAATNESHNFTLTGAGYGAYSAVVTVDTSNEVGQAGIATNNDTGSASFGIGAGLVIIPNFDGTITNDPQAATIESTINSAIAAYESRFSDPVTVHINVQQMGSGLGQSSSFIGTISYSALYQALTNHQTTVDDTNALSLLPTGSSNPVNGNSSIKAKLPLLRALGFSANPPSGSPDGTIGLNISICNLTTNSPNPSKYSLSATFSHEMDEVLGLGSALDIIKQTPGATLSDPVEPEDLFRYDGSGARSFTTNSNSQPGGVSYFSINGTTHLAQFNQEAAGDFGDWYSFFGGVTPEVQDAFATPGAFPVLNVELRALDVIGFTLVTPKTNQTITFGPLQNRALGEPAFGVSATASSGLPVSFSILSSPATLSSGTNVTDTALGTVTVRASQAGNGNYNAAANVDQSFTVFAPPTISTLLSNTNIVLTWSTNVAGFTVLTTTNLASNSWVAASPAPIIANGLYTFTNGVTKTNRFYRLGK